MPYFTNDGVGDRKLKQQMSFHFLQFFANFDDTLKEPDKYGLENKIKKKYVRENCPFSLGNRLSVNLDSFANITIYPLVHSGLPEAFFKTREIAYTKRFFGLKSNFRVKHCN